MVVRFEVKKKGSKIKLSLRGRSSWKKLLGVGRSSCEGGFVAVRVCVCAGEKDG